MDESNSESEAETQGPKDIEEYLCTGQAMKEEDKIAIIKKAIMAEQGQEGDDMDF